MTFDPHAPSHDSDADADAARLFRPRSTSGHGAAPCPPPDLVQASRAGVLPPALHERVARHVEGCLICQALGDALDDPEAGKLSEVEQRRIGARVQAEIDKTARDRRRRWAAAAAFVLIPLGVTLLWRAMSPAPEPKSAESRAPAGLDRLAPRPQGATTVRVSGRVTDAGGVPLSGVTVSEYIKGREEGNYDVGVTTRFANTTDSAGRYSISGQPSRPGPSITLRAARLGYFSAIGRTTFSEDMRVDLALHPWVLIPAGVAVKDTTRLSDAGCGTPKELCRQFAVRAPSTGTLEVVLSVSARTEFDLHLETPGQDVYGPKMGAPLQIAIPAIASATYQIRVYSYPTEPRPFELTTRMR